MDPNEAIGPPDYSGGGTGTGAVSLGSGGRIVLQFTDNALTGSDSPAHDLYIFEVGPNVEDTFVDISRDGRSSLVTTAETRRHGEGIGPV